MKRSILLGLLLVSLSEIAFAGSLRITRDGYFGCSTEVKFTKLSRLRNSGDNEAFGKAIRAALYSDECIAFNAGQSVQVEETAVFSGIVKLRRKGDVDGYWTNIEAAK